MIGASCCYHISSVPLSSHQTAMSYECLDCDRTFSTSEGVESHSRAKGHFIPECKECNRIFVDENALNNVSDINIYPWFISVDLRHLIASR